MVHALLEALYIGYGVHLLGDDESMDRYPEGSARVEMGDMNMGERAGACRSVRHIVRFCPLAERSIKQDPRDLDAGRIIS